jgi:hypothetical protein
MITTIKKLPAGSIGFRFNGSVTGKDYESVIFPALKKAVAVNKEIHLLCVFDEDFKKFKLSALIDDGMAGMKYFSDWKRIAIVSDNKTLNHFFKAMSFLVPGDLKMFTGLELKKAIKWLAAK